MLAKWRTCDGSETRQLVLAGLLTVAVLACSNPASLASDYSLTMSDCRDGAVLDYGAPLRRMLPPSKGPPVGSLPFLPGGLHLDRLGSRVGVGPTRVGFVLGNGSNGRREMNSGWEARSTLTAVRAGGRASRIVGKKRQSADRVISGAVDSMNLAMFRLPARKAFYRLKVVLQRGPETHAYWEYYRVLPRRVDLRLALSSASLAPGEKLSWRMENFGTLPLFYGLEYRVERLEASSWVVDPSSPDGFPAVGFFMDSGGASDCQSLRLPADMQPGLYLLSKGVEVGGGDRRVVSEFSVAE